MSDQHKHKTDEDTPKNFWQVFKNILFAMFSFLRFYTDIAIDKIYGWVNDKKMKRVKGITNPILLQSATSLAKKIHNRQLRAEEVVQAFIDRTKEVNPIINAVVDERFEKALEEARAIDRDIELGKITEEDFKNKPFLGIPFTSKETTSNEGLSFTFGLKSRIGTTATFDADVVTQMKKSGAILIGCSNIPQINMSQETSNPVYGITNNPYNSTRNVGGSSGGEGAILSAGGSALGIGTDIGGSIRIPAFMCGIFGHKPTSHVVSLKGIMWRTGEDEVTMLTSGPMTRYAEDIPRMLQVLAGDNAHKLKLDIPVNVKALKVYYVDNPDDPVISPFRPEMKKIFADVVKHFEEICVQKPQKIHLKGVRHATKLWPYWINQESNEDFKKELANHKGEVSTFVELLKYFTVGSDFTGAIMSLLVNGALPVNDKWAREETTKFRNELLSKLDDNSVLLYPSGPWPASYHHSSFLRPWNFNLFSAWSVAKFPSTQVPLGLGAEGLPLGIQVVSAPYHDRLSIAVAKELEATFGGYVPVVDPK